MIGRTERSLYERMLESITDRAERAEAEVRRLTQTIVELRREGFAYAPPEPEPEPEEELEQDLITAIAERAFPDSPEWSHLEREARRDLARGIPMSKIIEDITQGDDPHQHLD